MINRVAVHGAGLAGMTCALLLARDGFPVTLTGPSMPEELVLNEAAVAVFTEVWDDPRLLDGGHRLTGRWVRWGIGADPVEVMSPAVVLDGTRLLEQRLPTVVRREEAETPADWTIHAAARPAGNPPVGRRVAVVGHVPLADGDVSRLATTRRGWVQVVPLGDGRGVVRAVAPVPPEDLAAELAEAGLDEWVPEPPEQVTVVPAAPWLARQRAEPGRIHIGGAVLRLDPVSGSGAGHALRTAILAAAALRDIRDSKPVTDVLGHYHRRLGAAFHRHLCGCAAHYRTAFDSADWLGELHITATALTGQAAQLHPQRSGPVFTGRRDVAAMT
jgi:flavin-dependent dehydrogenase